MKLHLLLLTLTASFLTAAEPFLTRTYKINPATLATEKQSTTNTTTRIQSLLTATQIPFPPSNAQTPDTRAAFFAQSQNLLTIRATPAEHSKFETILAQHTKLPPQVSLESKFAEIPATATPAFQLTLGKAILSAHTNQPISSTPLTQPQYRVAIQALENREGVDLLSAPTVTTLSGRQARISIEETKVNLFQTPPPRPRRATPESPITPTTPEKAGY